MPWYQTGLLFGPNNVTENGTGGFYMFGGQRIWSNDNARKTVADGGKSKIVISSASQCLYDRTP